MLDFFRSERVTKNLLKCWNFSPCLLLINDRSLIYILNLPPGWTKIFSVGDTDNMHTCYLCFPNISWDQFIFMAVLSSIHALSVKYCSVVSEKSDFLYPGWQF